MEFEKICKMIAEVLKCDTTEITKETTFVEDLGADSLDMYQIMIKIEDEFEIKVDTEAAIGCSNVGQVLELIKRNNQI